MPEKTRKVTQRWNPGSASAALAAAAASSSDPSTAVKNPSTKNDTFVSEGSVKDRMSIWNANMETKNSTGGINKISRKLLVEPNKQIQQVSIPMTAPPADSNLTSLPSTNSYSTLSEKPTKSLSSSSTHSTESIENLTGRSSHKDRLAAWGKATQSLSQLSGDGVTISRRASASKVAHFVNGSTKMAPTVPEKTSRVSLMDKSLDDKSMSTIKATTNQGPSSSHVALVTSEMPVPMAGLSVRDRMKLWSKHHETPLPLSAGENEVSTSKYSGNATPTTSSTDPSVQHSESQDRKDLSSRTSTGTDHGSIAISVAPASNKPSTWKSPPPAFANRTLKEITPPQEDRHKHQRYTLSTLSSVDLKKVAPPVEDKHQQPKEHCTGSTFPTKGSKKVIPSLEVEQKSSPAEIGRPSMYAVSSLRNVVKPKEDKWKENSTAMRDRLSLYSSISLRNIEKPHELSKPVEDESSAHPRVVLRSVGAPKEEKWKAQMQRKTSGEVTSSSTSAVNTSSKLRLTEPRPISDEQVKDSFLPSTNYSPAHPGHVEKMKSDKWQSCAKTFNKESTATDSIGACGVGKFNAKCTHISTASLSAALKPDMPTGEKTKEMSPTSSPVQANSTLVSLALLHGERKTPRFTELKLQELPLESPVDQPKVPPSPLEVLVKENVVGGNKKLVMLMSSISGRQDQKTAQDRALTILKGLNVGPDKMELVDGAVSSGRCIIAPLGMVESCRCLILSV
jgi:hypothetical protein